MNKKRIGVIGLRSGPTAKQLEIYDYIVEYMVEHQYAPAVRDICKGVGLKSTSSVYEHLEKLKRYGLIDYLPMQPRTISVKGYKLMRDENCLTPVD